MNVFPHSPHVGYIFGVGFGTGFSSVFTEKDKSVLINQDVSESILHYICINNQDLCPGQPCKLSGACELVRVKLSGIYCKLTCYSCHIVKAQCNYTHSVIVIQLQHSLKVVCKVNEINDLFLHFLVGMNSPLPK